MRPGPDGTTTIVDWHETLVPPILPRLAWILGRPIIGRAEVISDVPVPAIAAYHDSRYIGRNLVVAAAGNVEHDRLVALVKEAWGDARDGTPERPAPAPDSVQPRASFHRKATEQYHLCLGAPGIARRDDRRFALRVLDTLLGGSSSSRLFQEVREKRGLAYSVYSYASHYVDSGQIGVYVGTRPDNVGEAVKVIADELRKVVSEPVSDEELGRAKENVKGQKVLSFELSGTARRSLEEAGDGRAAETVIAGLLGTATCVLPRLKRQSRSCRQLATTDHRNRSSRRR